MIAQSYRLFQYCKREALKVIKCCAVMSPRALLKERFGDDYRISEMWVKKVTKGPIMRHGEGRCLQELADDLRSCKETLKAMSKLEEIDTRRTMIKIVESESKCCNVGNNNNNISNKEYSMEKIKIVETLPQSLQSQWRKLVVKTLEATGR